MVDKKSKRRREGLGIAGFILGILSIVMMGIFGLILSIIGGIFCIIQQKNNSTKLGKAGLILNSIGFILSLLWIFYLGPILAQYINSLGY